MEPKKTRDVRAIYEDQIAFAELSAEFPNDIEQLSEVEDYPIAQSLLSRLALDMSQLGQRKPEIPAEGLLNCDQDSHLDDEKIIFELLRESIDSSEIAFEEKQAVILSAHEACRIYKESLQEARSKKSTKYKKIISGSEKAIIRKWDLSKLLQNPEHLELLDDTLRCYEDENIGTCVDSILRKTVENYVRQIGNEITQEELNGLFSLLAKAVHSEDLSLVNFIRDTLTISIDAVGQADSDEVMDHYAKCLLAIAQLGSDPEAQKIILDAFGDKAVFIPKDSMYRFNLILGTQVSNSPHSFALLQIVGELYSQYELSSIFDDTQNLFEPLMQFVSGDKQVTPDDKSKRLLLLLANHFKIHNLDPANLSKDREICAAFGNEYVELTTNKLSELMNEVMVEASEGGDAPIGFTEEIFNAAQRKSEKETEALMKDLISRYSVKYPHLKTYFEQMLSTENDELMQKFRVISGGRSKMSTMFNIVKNAPQLPGDIESLVSHLNGYPEHYIDGFIVQIVPGDDEHELISIDDIPKEMIAEVTQHIATRPRHMSPRVLKMLRGNVLHFRPTTNSDSEKISQLDKLDSLKGRLISDVDQLQLSELKHKLETLRNEIFMTSHRFVNQRGFSCELKVDQSPLTIVMKQPAKTPSVVMGSLTYLGQQLYFVFDHNRQIHFSNAPQSMFATEMAIFLSNVLKEYACSPVLESEDGGMLDEQHILLKRIAHLRQLPAGQKASAAASQSFLEEQGQDLRTVSERRKSLLETSSETTYVRAVEKDILASGPIRLNLSLEALSKI